MPDLLIRDVPEEVIAGVDARARHMGLSRTEYLRRQLVTAATPVGRVTVDDFRRLAEICADAKDPEVMARAWQ